MFSKKTNKEEVYSSTNLSDLLSSPVFYSVIALTFILGVSSIFGFFNNPRKLKTMVDVISQKLLISPNSNTVSFDIDEDYLLQKYSLKKSMINREVPTSLATTDSTYDIFSKSSNLSFESSTKRGIQLVSFDYDITSKQFWGNLDASNIESAFEESLRENVDAIVIGAPLSPEYHLEKGDSKYTMGAGLLRI